MLRNKSVWLVVGMLLAMTLVGCASPEEKAKAYYDKGIALLESDPAKAKLEFQNALQMKKDMTEALYGLALVAEKQADWKACFGLLNKVLDNQPKNTEALVKIAQLFLAAGEIDKAKQHVDNALQISPGHLGATMVLAAIDLKQHQYQSAIEKANKVLQQDPNNIDAYMLLASERYAQQDLAGALSYLNQGVAIDANSLLLQLFKINVLVASGDPKQAEDNFKSLVDVRPNELDLRKKYAEFLIQQNNTTEAEVQLRKIIATDTSEIQPKLNLVQFLLKSKGPDAGRAVLEDFVKQTPDDVDLNFHLIDLYEAQQDFPAAENQLRHMIQIAGNKPEGLSAKVKVATKLLGDNKKPEAMQLIKEVLDTDARHVEALIVKAGVAIDDMQYESAILDLRSVLRDQPNSAQAYFFIARAYELTGSSALAEESYSKAMEMSKYSASYAVPYAKLLMNKNLPVRAEEVLLSTLKRNPGNIAATKLLTQLKFAKGDFAGAQAIANSTKNASNSNLSALIEAEILMRQGDDAGSIALLEAAHKQMPDDMQTITAIVKIHLNKQRTDAAKLFLKEVLVANPENYDAKLLLAQVFEAANETAKAHEIFDNIIAIEPQKIDAYEQLASSYAKVNNLASAKAVIEKGLLVNPGSVELNMLLAEIHQMNKQYKAAMAVYEKILLENPSMLVALNNYVSIVADYESDTSMLDETYVRAQKLKGAGVPLFLDSLGWISYRVNKLDEATQYLKEATTKIPNNATLHYHLGKVYLAKKDQVNARVSLEKALTLSKKQDQALASEIAQLLKNV
jgi:predicted Zn-dependent protease